MNFLLLIPEILVAVLAGCIIIVDLFVPERFKGSFPYVSIAGLSLIVVFYIFSGLPPSPSFLQNVIVVDHFTSFFRILFLLLGIGVLFASGGKMKELGLESLTPPNEIPEIGYERIGRPFIHSDS